MTDREYLKFTSAQLRGRRARVVVRIQSKGGDVINPGAVVTIRDKGGGLAIATDECETCHQSAYVRGVAPESLELLPGPARNLDE